MLKLNTLAPAPVARKNNKRVGRGPGSGAGKTASRGHKGARARTGYSMKAGFEGGQMPLHRRLPKRGFKNIFKEKNLVVTLSMLDGFATGTVIDQKALVQAGIILNESITVKILANGEITKALTVKLAKVSEGAKARIVEAGGTVEEI